MKQMKKLARFMLSENRTILVATLFLLWISTLCNLARMDYGHRTVYYQGVEPHFAHTKEQVNIRVLTSDKLLQQASLVWGYIPEDGAIPFFSNGLYGEGIHHPAEVIAVLSQPGVVVVPVAECHARNLPDRAGISVEVPSAIRSGFVGLVIPTFRNGIKDGEYVLFNYRNGWLEVLK